MTSFLQQRKFKWPTIVVVSIFLSVMFFASALLNPTLHSFFKNVGLERLVFDNKVTLNNDQINKLVLSLKANNINYLQKYFKKNPELFSSIQEQLSQIEEIDDTNIYQSGLFELFFELRLSERLIKQNFNNSGFENLVNMEINESFNTILKHSHDIKNLTFNQERLLAEVVKYRASYLSEGAVFNTQYFVSLYKHEKSKQSKHGLFERALLQASWLLQASQEKGKLVDIADDFKNIRKSLETPSDLVRLINHKNESVVINSASLIKYYLPKNAIHGLRFQLIRTKSAKVKMALLDALSAYGTEARMVTKQLKKMIKTTTNQLVREKITQTINNLNG